MNYRYASLDEALHKVLTEPNRVTAFGFLPGKEVKAAGVGNLGLHDREYISRDFAIVA